MSTTHPPPLADEPLVDVDAVRANGFCLVTRARAFSSEWHAHRKHQLLYAAKGTLHLEVADAQWVLPPQRAALLRAGVRHQVRAERPSELCTVYFAPAALAPAVACAVFALAPVAQEMIRYAARWGPTRSPGDKTAHRYFATLAALLPDWSQSGATLRLPSGRSPELQLAMAHVLAHLGEALSLREVARAAATSPRTLARRFEQEAQLGYRDFLRLARVHRAMELLALPQARVGQVGRACGFASFAAFTHAFSAVARERPSDFRRRLRGAAAR